MIKVGILGTGYGKIHAERYSKMKNVEIVGIFGRNEDKLNKIKNELGLSVTTDINKLLLNPDIQVMDICLPTELHAKYVIESLKQNKHVFCETPVTYSVNEAEQIKTYAMKYNKNVFVDLFYKFSAPHKYTYNLIQTGELGKPLSIITYNRTPALWGDLGLPNIVMDFMIHNVDFIKEIFENPEKIIAQGMGDNKKALVYASIHFNNGFSSIESSSILPDGSPFCIGYHMVCEEGMITYDAQFGKQTNETLIMHYNDKVKEVNFKNVDELDEVIKHVLQCVNTQTKSSLIDIDNAIDSLRIVEGINSSMKSFQ